ncbi:MAG: Mrp/NBP35 family ATP-binding protein [Candidatus Lokiarchaeota archaeon]|nr:Mrp/NBP35 family ATP-binding protein [Candidatus Harpocratesius repetitus]
MQKIKHKIIVCSGKGGVGKSTVATNLAVALASQGLSVGVLDVDITGPNIPKMLNLEGRRPEIVPGTKKFKPVNGPLNIQVMSMAFLLETPDTPVIWRGPLKMGAIRQFIADGAWEPMDYLVIDLPPGTSDETLDIMQLTKGSVVIVTTPQEVAMMDSRKTVQMSKTLQLDVVGIVENMSGLVVKCPHCNETIEVDVFGFGGGEKAARELDVPFLGKIPLEPIVREQGDLGLPVVLKDPESESAKAFERVIKKIRESVE